MKERAEILKAMHKIVINMNDKSAYSAWIWLIPDGADDEELESIAEDDEETFKEACELFRKLIKFYGDGGFYVGEKAY